MRRMFSAMLAIAAFAVAISTLPALARPMASSARTCHNHAGTFEGDGEYSDGAVQEASGISCARALALVKTRYHWIYAHWNQAYHHGFRIRSFSCHMKPEGPDDLKICRDGHRRFDFV